MQKMLDIGKRRCYNANRKSEGALRKLKAPFLMSAYTTDKCFGEEEKLWKK